MNGGGASDEFFDHTGRTSASAGAHCQSGCQPLWQVAVPGIAEVTSPAGIARRP